MTRGNLSPSLCARGSRRRHVALALLQALEKFVAFAAAAHHHVLVLEHRLDDAQDRFRAQVIAAIEAVHGLEDFFLRRVGIFERALLQAVGVQDVALILLDEPAVELGLFVELGAGVGGRQRDLQAEDVQLLGEIDRLLDRLPRLHR